MRDDCLGGIIDGCNVVGRRIEYDDIVRVMERNEVDLRLQLIEVRFL